MKYKITIKRILQEEYEMVLEDETIMRAFDEARKLTAARNATSRIGRFFVTKIEEVKEE
jgi:hypothetical protein